MKISNPATNQTIREIEEDSASSIQQKFTRARSAQPSWSQTPLQTRLAAITRFRDLTQSNKERLARTLTQEVGKPITQSRNEITALPNRINFFLENVEKVIARRLAFADPKHNLEEKITHEPLGVIANISAWNYPYFVGSNVFIPALLTGNTVLYKPSEFATLTGLAIADLMYEAGIPRDIFTPIIGAADAGQALLDQPLDAIFFTGSCATGQRIAEHVARRLMKVQLELGGKDPTYVCDDVDVKVAAESLADGAFYNTGQSCCSVERIYLHEKNFDPFVEHFLRTVKTFVIGDPMDEKTYIGPLTRPAQIALLEAQVADAGAKGAKLLVGGRKLSRPGNYFEPTVLINVDHTMKVMRDESFGPIIGLQKVKDDAEAVTLMNDTEYGLTAGVYTRDESRACEILSKVNTGSVYINCCDRVSPHLPWTGRRRSGLGSTLGLEGIAAFTTPKAWHVKTG